VIIVREGQLEAEQRAVLVVVALDNVHRSARGVIGI
jgi:hypothetical protein